MTVESIAIFFGLLFVQICFGVVLFRLLCWVELAETSIRKLEGDVRHASRVREHIAIDNAAIHARLLKLENPPASTNVLDQIPDSTSAAAA